MKILILNNFFNYYSQIPKYKKKSYFIKFYKTYNEVKLKQLIKKISKNNNPVEFKIITTGDERFNFGKNIKVELLSEFRLKIEREDYLSIYEKIKNETKKNLIKLYQNFSDLSVFHFKGTSFIKLFEHNFILIFNKNFEEFEVLKRILQMETYDRVIFFNYNLDFIDFIRSLNSKFKNIETYQNSILKRINKRLSWHIILFLIYVLKDSFKGLVKKKKPRNLKIDFQKKQNIIFYAKLKSNSLASINQIHDHFKKTKDYNPIYYKKKLNFIPLRDINKLIKNLFLIKKIWLRNKDKITKSLEYDLISLNGFLKEFYDLELLFSIITSSNELNQFKSVIKNTYPSILILTEGNSVITRLILNYCKVKNIPTVFIPHAALINFVEVIIKTDFSHILVSGEVDKSYYLKKGEPSSKILITGRPQYDCIFKGTINRLTNVRDMYSNKIFEFKPEKFTILFTTNFHPLNFKSNKKLLIPVFESLKSLNLIDNLIIKLHPMEKGTFIKRILEKLKVEPIIVKDYNILDLINSSDLIISKPSTTILEAMIIGKPVILIDFINLPHDRKYLFLEGTNVITAKNQDILTENLQKLSTNKDFYNNYSINLIEWSKRGFFYDNRSSPIEKITKFITKTIKNNKIK